MGQREGRWSHMPFRLIHLSDDELELLFIALGDLLRPRVAIALSSTCQGLRRPTVAAGATLRKRTRRCRRSPARPQ